MEDSCRDAQYTSPFSQGVTLQGMLQRICVRVKKQMPDIVITIEYCERDCEAPSVGLPTHYAIVREWSEPFFFFFRRHRSEDLFRIVPGFHYDCSGQRMINAVVCDETIKDIVRGELDRYARAFDAVHACC